MATTTLLHCRHQEATSSTHRYNHLSLVGYWLCSVQRGLLEVPECNETTSNLQHSAVHVRIKVKCHNNDPTPAKYMSSYTHDAQRKCGANDVAACSLLALTDDPTSQQHSEEERKHHNTTQHIRPARIQARRNDVSLMHNKQPLTSAVCLTNKNTPDPPTYGTEQPTTAAPATTCHCYS